MNNHRCNGALTVAWIFRHPFLLTEKLVQVWESSVRATHLFLSEEEIEKIKEYVPEALKEVEVLVVIRDENHQPAGFMGVEDQRLEMLFITQEKRGKGFGKALLQYGMKNYYVNSLTVNEQNPAARDFYEHMGFKTYKRTKVDEQGNPYPLLYMRPEK